MDKCGVQMSPRNHACFISGKTLSLFEDFRLEAENIPEEQLEDSNKVAEQE
jgi:hypothetical protein